MGHLWQEFCQAKGYDFIKRSIELALDEDGEERTAKAIFTPTTHLSARIRAKEETLIVGLPLIEEIFKVMKTQAQVTLFVEEGAKVSSQTILCSINALAVDVLKAERVILNYLCHLSGIANLTAKYVAALEGTGVRLLDTRKTTPGLRWPEKYAVRMGGGYNHRMDLSSMLMLKDNHIDATGSITNAVATLRKTYAPCPPIEVECRTKDDVLEAVASNCERIMLDNMSIPQLSESLPLIPPSIEAEISGGVTLQNIRELALIGPRHADFISVGRLTHSASSADLSMTLTCEGASS